MGPRSLKVISRRSELAVTQVDEALTALEAIWPQGTSFERVLVETPGDRDLRTPLDDAAIPDDFFTRDLDRALLEGRADLAVHSAKDLPERPVEGLTIAAFLPCREPRDALVLRRTSRPKEPGRPRWGPAARAARNRSGPATPPSSRGRCAATSAGACPT